MYNDYQNGPEYKVIGKSVEDCKAQLFTKYGNNYQPVNIGTYIKEGFLGFGRKEYVEMKYIIRTPGANIPKSHPEEFEKNKSEILNKLGVSVDSSKQLASLDKKIDQKLDEKFDELSNLISTGLSNISVSSDTKHANVLRIEEMLEENEFSKEYIRNISEKIRAEFSLEEIEDFDKVEKQVVDWIGESIDIAQKKAHRQPHVIVLVGPTGVGKTTTIAKLAAQQVIGARKEGIEDPVIRLISADVTRVAAEEQLRRYGEALKIQVDKAENADDIKTIFRQCKDSTDVILIDTSGYSPNDSEHIGRLKKNLSVDGLRPDVYLAFSASTKSRDLRNIIQNYEPFAFSSVIITKCDETQQYGNIISVLAEKHKSISFVTYGQSPAKDISRPKVVDFLIRLNGFKIDRVHIEDKFGE
ncbi:AAA family ATPase [Treponema sp.]|uniref:AAA family ATPase n=1 Tax=Treponema sp. TaxID=166 RepID=UPI00298E4285|nr:AAA family ATPase [Treponema sp.]